MKKLHPDSLPPPFARYSHGVEIPAGQRIVRTSGQLGMKPDGSIPESAQEQAEVCFGNIAGILAEAGMGRGNVFHVSAYVTDRADMAGYMQARDAYLADVDEARLPSSTLLIVSGFTRAEFKVEVEVWAAG